MYFPWVFCSLIPFFNVCSNVTWPPPLPWHSLSSSSSFVANTQIYIYIQCVCAGDCVCVCVCVCTCIHAHWTTNRIYLFTACFPLLPHKSSCRQRCFLPFFSPLIWYLAYRTKISGTFLNELTSLIKDGKYVL